MTETRIMLTDRLRREGREEEAVRIGTKSANN